MSSQGWPPTILADSGNGAHLEYRIDLPNDEKSTALVRAVIEAIGQQFTGQGVDVDRKVFNAARIWKLYGTTARKAHNMPDRPHRLAQLVEVPERVEVVPVEKLRALAAMVAKPEPSRPTASSNGDGRPRLDVPAWLTARGVAFKVKDRPGDNGQTVYILDECPFDSNHKKTATVMQWPSGKLGAQCFHNSCSGKHWQEFKQAIGAPDADHWDPPLRNHQGNGEARHQGGAADAESTPAEQRKAIDYHPMTCADLIAAKFDIRFLAEHILVAGQPFLVCGPQKALKTSLLVDLAFSLATAGYFLGKFRVPRAVAVGIMSAESGLATLKETIQRVARAAGVDPSTVHNLIISDRVPQLSSLEHLDALAEFLDRFALVVLIIDPAFLAMDGADAGNLFIQGQLLRRVSELCQERGVTLILCHHTKKAAGVAYEPLELASIAWSGFAEFARGWLLVSRREPYAPGTGSHRLWLTVGGSVGHGGLWGVNVEEGVYSSGGGRYWQVEVLEPAEVKEAAHDRKDAERQAKTEAVAEKDCQRVLRAAAKYPDGETPKRLREATGLMAGRFNAAIARLLDRCELVPCELVKANRNKPYDGYKLAGENPQ